MSRRRDIQKHRRSLDEIHDIMNSMKNLSYMETRKINDFLDVQHSVVRHIETVATDFLSFYPDTLAEPAGSAVEVHLLIGAERGFCGDFNHALLRRFEAITATRTLDKLHLICIGHRLQMLLQNDEREIIAIDGASVAEEVGKVLNQIVKQLSTLQKRYGSLKVYAHYQNDEHQFIEQQLLPPFQHLLYHQQEETHEPVLNLEPRKFLLEMSYHYLFVVLYEILYTSLMAENRQRMEHLENAVRHMDEQSEELQRQENILRQEEIIEEIEVILLSTVSFDEQPFTG